MSTAKIHSSGFYAEYSLPADGLPSGSSDPKSIVDQLRFCGVSDDRQVTVETDIDRHAFSSPFAVF